MKQLTAKNGQSEWQYEGKTLIAIEKIGICTGCYFDGHEKCSLNAINILCFNPKGKPYAKEYKNKFFKESPFVIFIEKSAEK